MSSIPPSQYESTGSGILQEALIISCCNRKDATHFVIQHGNRLKYLIELKSGIKHLKRTIAAYDTGLLLLLRLISFIPKQLLIFAKLGYFANVKLHPAVNEKVPTTSRWNILVGAYDDVQKIVLQCFDQEREACTFIKVGNKGSAEQMEREINFLRNAGTFQTFTTPILVDSVSIHNGSPFTILITKDFKGKKINHKLTEKLFNIATEIAGEPILVNGEPHTFSHGDFAPWNIRKNGNGFIVFDWEHYGLRPEGYDLIYFHIMIEIALNHRNFDEAYNRALRTVKRFNPNLSPNRELILHHFSKTTKALNYK